MTESKALARATEALRKIGHDGEHGLYVTDMDSRVALSAALRDPDDPDWLAKLLAEAHGFRAGGLFFDEQMPDDSAGSVSAMRDKYRRQAAALTSKILGEA